MEERVVEWKHEAVKSDAAPSKVRHRVHAGCLIGATLKTHVGPEPPCRHAEVWLPHFTNSKMV
jgi:hypothetical protein